MTACLHARENHSVSIERVRTSLAVDSGKTDGEEQDMRKLLIIAVALASMTSLVAAVSPDLSVLPGEFSGVVMYPDGRTPVEGLAVRVWDAQTEKIVFRTRTDKDGAFGIPELPEGDRYVTVGSVRIDMKLLTARAGITPQPHGLVIVLPKRMPLAPILIPSTATAAALPKIMSP